MMRILLKFLLVYSLLSLFQGRIEACTSFAVYSDETWYGMNFDYPETDIRFLINTIGSNKVFRAEFGNGSYIAGMNESGLFTNYQLLYYNHGDPIFATSNILGIGTLCEYSSTNLSTVSEVNSYLGSRLLVPSWGLDLHTLFADTTGNAMIAEPFGPVNGISYVENGFLVMTNFPNYDFLGDDYTSVYGVGSDRYKLAFGYIQDHMSDFEYEHGLETLSRTVQSVGEYPTQISLLFDPINMEIYFCFDHNFSYIWKVSFLNETIETYSGFSWHITHPLGVSGIWSYDLINDITDIKEHFGYNNVSAGNRIHPNPAFQKVDIDLHSLPGQESGIEIYSNNGTLVYRETFLNGTETSIDLSYYPKGIYIVRILNDDDIISGRVCIE